jgi:hypothetical protein
MMRQSRATVGTVGLLIGGVWLLALTPGYAYIDPGTGSYFFQLMIGAALGGAYAIKMSWGKICAFARQLLHRKRTKE